MRAQFVTLCLVVVGTSLLTALGLVYLRKAEPERRGFSNRFRYFFGQCLIMVGIWAALCWLLFGRSLSSRP
jgi:hypothetical protein